MSPVFGCRRPRRPWARALLYGRALIPGRRQTDDEADHEK